MQFLMNFPPLACLHASARICCEFFQLTQAQTHAFQATRAYSLTLFKTQTHFAKKKHQPTGRSCLIGSGNTVTT